MKNNKTYILLILLFLIYNSISAQKCDTLIIDGSPNPYGCPQRALNIYKAIFKKVSDAIFEPLNKASINYCNNCSLQNWSNYNFNNQWTNNPFQFSSDIDYNWKTEPTGVPCSEEREPAFFLGNVKTNPLIGIYANLPTIYTEGQKMLNNIYQIKADSLQEVYKRKGLNFGDINHPLFREYSAAAKLLGDEGTFHQLQSSFTLVFEYNRTSLDYPNDESSTLKKTPFKLDIKFTIPYISTDNLVDISNFQARDEEEKQFTDFSKKPNIGSKLGKSYETWVQLGQYIPDSKTENLRINADYSVYNFVVKIQGISFEKNHEILNAIDWNKLYSFINTKKL